MVEGTGLSMFRSDRIALTALMTRDLRPEDRSSGQNLGLALGLALGSFRRRRRRAHVRQVFAFLGAVGDWVSHFGYSKQSAVGMLP